MTTTAGATAPRTGRGSRALPWILGVVALVVVAVVAGRPGRGSDGTYFDPASTSPSGARGLVVLLESFGAEVDTTSNLPSADTDVAFMFADVIAEADHGVVDDWVANGGVLVVADPYSTWSAPLASGTGGSAFALRPSEVLRGECDIASLRQLRRVEPGGYSETFDVSDDPLGDASSCFTRSDLGPLDGAFVVEEVHGRGRVVSVGGPLVFVNEWLDQADNAALATGLLLTPSPASELDGQADDSADDQAAEPVDVAILQYGGTGIDGDRALTDALGTGAKVALVQLSLAFLAYAWFRARRVGRPIVETQPVALAGSELVSAVGQLLHQSDDPDRSARALRADLRRRLGERFGLGSHAPPDVIAAVVADRTGIDRDHLSTIVGSRPVTTDRELVQLAADIDDLRKEILHGP